MRKKLRGCTCTGMCTHTGTHTITITGQSYEFRHLITSTITGHTKDVWSKSFANKLGPASLMAPTPSSLSTKHKELEGLTLLYDVVCIAETTELPFEVKFGLIIVGWTIHPFIEDGAKYQLVRS